MSSSSTSNEDCLTNISLDFEHNRIKNKLLINHCFPKEFIFSHYKDEFMFVLMFLFHFTQITFFNLNYPKDILIYIIQIYWDIVVDIMKKKIDVYNICPCNKSKCIKEWYKRGEEFRSFKYTWYISHCNSKFCHNIFNDEEGYECCRCEEYFCNSCDDDVSEDDDNKLCKKCITNEDGPISINTYSSELTMSSDTNDEF